MAGNRTIRMIYRSTCFLGLVCARTYADTAQPIATRVEQPDNLDHDPSVDDLDHDLAVDKLDHDLSVDNLDHDLSVDNMYDMCDVTLEEKHRRESVLILG